MSITHVARTWHASGRIRSLTVQRTKLLGGYHLAWDNQGRLREHIQIEEGLQRAHYEYFDSDGKQLVKVQFNRHSSVLELVGDKWKVHEWDTIHSK